MDNVNTHHDMFVPVVSPPASEVENGKSAEEMAVDKLKTLLLPLVAKLKKAKEAWQISHY
eukprot:15365260-Ditylum_brightwellii.AAC.1